MACKEGEHGQILPTTGKQANLSSSTTKRGNMWYLDLAGGSNIFYVHPYLDLDVQFDEYFSNGLVQPPTRGVFGLAKKDSIHTQEFEKCSR